MSNEARTSLTVLDEILCTALAVGLVIVAIVPAARGMSTIGWLPMWLVAMPALAWWASHGFALPRRRDDDTPTVAHAAARMRRTQPQARRRVRTMRAEGARNAA